ncbi:FDLD family class I lanthipeptide [Pseudomonas syringae group genomosp. 3]
MTLEGLFDLDAQVSSADSTQTSPRPGGFPGL